MKVAPCSPQWQRKLEAPLRVILNCVNKHPDHPATSKLTILWKTVTLMCPQQDAEIHEDATAWARLHYGQEGGKFIGRLEVVQELFSIMQGQPSEVGSTNTTLWDEQWYQAMWGNHLELDRTDAAAFSAAKQNAVVSGKGLQKGKGKRHWSSAAVHSDSYEPFPFDLNVVVVEAVYFSWDEFCDKFKKEDRKIGDYEVATVQRPSPSGSRSGAPCRPHRRSFFSSFSSFSSCTSSRQRRQRWPEGLASEVSWPRPAHDASALRLSSLAFLAESWQHCLKFLCARLCL